MEMGKAINHPLLRENTPTSVYLATDVKVTIHVLETVKTQIKGIKPKQKKVITKYGFDVNPALEINQ